MKTITNDISSGRLKKAYLLYGEEVYLRNQYRDLLVKAMNPDLAADTMNFAKFEGKDIDTAEIVSLADTMPFFADFRTILIQDSGLFKKADDGFADYFKNSPSETTRFIFVESEVDKRNRLYKVIKEYGSAVEFVTLDEEKLKLWVGKRLSNYNMRITGNNALYFLSKTGNDMSTIKNEIDKLISYVGDRSEVTAEDIDAIVTTTGVNRIFEMMDSIILKEQTKALNLYYELLSLRQQPSAILNLLARHFNILLQIRDLKSKGYSNKEMSAKVGVNGYFISNYISQASKFTNDILISALNDCNDADANFKKGIMSDKLAVEMLICKYSS